LWLASNAARAHSQRAAEESRRSQARETDSWEAPDKYESDELWPEVKDSNFLYTPRRHTSPALSTPEKEFEQFLYEQQANILWWWKNGESNEAFLSTTYDKDETDAANNLLVRRHLTFPDYLVMTKEDEERKVARRLWILEVKGVKNPDVDVSLKAAALLKAASVEVKRRKDLHLPQLEVVAGVVVNIKDKTWIRHSGGAYTHPESGGIPEGWEALEFTTRTGV
jgi:hypothetical protein